MKERSTDENYDVIVNPDKGDFEIWRNREVVADEDYPHLLETEFLDAGLVRSDGGALDAHVLALDCLCRVDGRRPWH